MSRYTLVAHSRASAVFYPGKGLSVSVDAPGGTFQAYFSTGTQAGFEAPLPVDFHAEVTGEAGSIEEAETLLENAANQIAVLIAFVTNADLGQLETEIVFGSGPDDVEHDFMQRFVTSRPVLEVPSRPID